MRNHTKSFMTAAVAVLLLGQVQAIDKCHALVLSGGGNKGSYEAGTIYGMAHILDASEVTWDVVSGVSAGAMNSGGISIWEVGNEVAMSEWLTELWVTLDNSNIYQMWPGGYAQGIFKESGVFDDTPLVELVTKIMTEGGSIKKHLIVSADDSVTGDYVPFDSDKFPADEMPIRVVSSASIPFIFPDRHIDDWILMDGGTVWNTNMVTAIDKCMELVGDKSKIVVDIAICGHAQIDTESQIGDTVSNFLRFREIKKYYKELDDIIEFEQAEPEINFRYLFVPSQPLKSGIQELNFTAAATGPMVELGKSDAAHVISLGEGKSFEFLKNYSESADLKKQYATFNDYLHAQH